jgi:hypothetical protein
MEGLLCGEGNGGPGGFEGKGKDDVMVMWGNPFVWATFKTLGMFNIFHFLKMYLENALLGVKSQWALQKCNCPPQWGLGVG